MVKIKRKVEMNLPQLIEWGWNNGVENKEYVCNEFKAKSVIFNLSGWAEFSDEFSYNPHDTFTVEVEEEIDENTKIEKMLAIKDDEVTLHHGCRLGQFERKDGYSFFLIDDEGTFALIYRDGKLV
ncbi:hypothetical protein [Mammaliicoccus vitulinus]|uniref:hypothetical protein n=1 Tax=Mammaliicoccus vitulinus TaxID=71237 RepID=UPI00248C619C|nr:hypothetical protein [Mammaliicoccus vitulinus]